jgi:hypothetical protein
MVDKIFALLGSVRFWILTLTAVVSVLQGMPFLEVFQVWAAAVVGLGTLDSVTKNMSR